MLKFHPQHALCPAEPSCLPQVQSSKGRWKGTWCLSCSSSQPYISTKLAHEGRLALRCPSHSPAKVRMDRSLWGSVPYTEGMGLSCKAGQGPCRLMQIFIYLFIFREDRLQPFTFPSWTVLCSDRWTWHCPGAYRLPPAPGTLPPMSARAAQGKGVFCVEIQVGKSLVSILDGFIFINASTQTYGK